MAKERRSWQWQIVMVLPSSICVEIATPHEIKLAVPALIQMEIPGDIVDGGRLRSCLPGCKNIRRVVVRLDDTRRTSHLDATAIFLQGDPHGVA